MKKIILGLTGASGSIYFLRLLEQLSMRDMEIHVVASSLGEEVLKYETGTTLSEEIERLSKNKAKIVHEDNSNLFSAAASGSSRFDGMAIVPCSMSSLAKITCGITDTLLTRAADVMLKERRKLVLVPREAPVSTTHLQNMAKLSGEGAVILPAMPGFYNHPQTMDDLINFVVGKTLDALEIENEYYERWEGHYEK
ncbi:UbiX family flavin prenyltransferase [Konateibacter massiliensis]|uniref:UbiX family flavin prenyltransferase n=1 Tax=Konateibacter massiliensis TaxID=2002841 RepID=UPI000C14D71A|nr:flavin prenyltransferase UbiX [Konateibacter massiliensis]